MSDGIFGVGVAEVLIIGLVLFVIGGPENTAKWARQLGRTVRQVRQAWSKMITEFEQDLGPEGKELLDLTRELNQNVSELRNPVGPRRLLSEASRAVESAVAEVEEDMPSKQSAEIQSNGEEPEPDAKKYQAWLPPEDRPSQ
jgi:Sec-independent protein translocase protein TatA